MNLTQAYWCPAFDERVQYMKNASDRMKHAYKDDFYTKLIAEMPDVLEK